MHRERENMEWLDQISKDMGYQVPEGYFADLQDRVCKDLYIRRAENREVPEGYFAALPDRVLAEVSEMEAKKINMVSWLPRIAAAVLIGVLAISIYLFTGEREEVQDDWWSIELIEYQIDELDLGVLIESDLIDETVLEETRVQLLEDRYMENYLIDNLDDIDENYLDELH